ncbi:MAG: F0F1 ATP synthase subunit alpha, partial [Alphaproteobacteria bacterium]
MTQKTTQAISEIASVLKREIADFAAKEDLNEVGFVLTVGDGIARVYGLDTIQSGEMVEFPNGVTGVALSLEEGSVGIVIMGDSRGIKENDVVRRTHRILQIPVGMGLLGRVVDALGNPIDGKGPIDNVSMRETETKAPGIIARQSVSEPVQTGIKAIDALVPI